ncbi:MAG: nucleoside deaminase [Pirellulaceae bacterium]|nr:nucleoside deaminase [Planctomycetales bacterium]
MPPEQLMQLAIDKALDGIRGGQSPFGCAIARDGRVLSVSHNIVWQEMDITAHAEITAIRAACRSVDAIHLEHAVVATTCEPCPMCMAALHWARVEVVYFGASIDDATIAGFNELTLPAAELLRIGGSTVKLVPQVLRERCVELFRTWKTNSGRSY